MPEPAQGATVRDEVPADRAAVFRVVSEAFGRPDEAHLVQKLREDADPCISLVAERDAEVVGHVLFSPVVIEEAEKAPPLGALAPLDRSHRPRSTPLSGGYLRMPYPDCPSG